MPAHRIPRPGRPTMSARQAAKLLRRDPRTVQRMVRDGELQGGSHTVNERTRWFVYADQFTTPALEPTASRTTRRQDDEIATLRAEVAAANAQKEATEETNRLLLATQSILLSALGHYQKASQQTAELADTYRDLSTRQSEASSEFRQSADEFARALNNYRDIISQSITPDDLSSLKPDRR